MPSMLLYFWNDPDSMRYRDACFSTCPGVWRHGDWITLTSHGSLIVHGRSDSTLNRNGVRLGSADIQGVVERPPEITEALVIGVEEPDGGYWMPLFVVLADGATLDDTLRDKSRHAIRTGTSPCHVPDEKGPRAVTEQHSTRADRRHDGAAVPLVGGVSVFTLRLAD